MNSQLILKEKSDNRIVYFYSADSSKGIPMVSDGEIEVDLVDNTIQTLRTATHDNDGYRARWLYPHIMRIIIKEGCPKRRLIATG